MKKQYLIIILFFLTNITFSQINEDKEHFIGFEFNYGGILTPEITYSYKKITIKGGPVICQSELMAGVQSELEKRKIYGGILTFQIRPNNNKHFDLFFVGNISYYKFVNPTSKDAIQDLGIDEQKKALRPTIGYGFNYKFLKSFYLKTSVAIGYSFQEIIHTDKPTDNDGEVYGNIFIGIGYNFKI